MKATAINLSCSNHFLDRARDRNVDMSAIIEINQKLNAAKIGETVIGGSQRTTIVATRVAYNKAVLVTAYPTKKNTENKE